MEVESESEEDFPEEEDLPEEDLLPPDLEELPAALDLDELALGVEEEAEALVLLLPLFLEALPSDEEEALPFLEEDAEEVPPMSESEVPELPKPEPELLSPMLLVVEPETPVALKEPSDASELELLPMLPEDEDEVPEPEPLPEPEEEPKPLFC